MKKFRINVNGKQYEVEVEEITSGETPSVVPVQQAAAKAAPAQPKTSPVQSAPAVKKESQGPVSASDRIVAPMPGNIISVNIKEGDSVKKGDVLFILEAMKMENEVMAHRDGKVAEVKVSKGAAVNTDDILAVIQ